MSDSVGYVATECQKCPIGAFVSLEKQPGTRAKHCRACPRGTFNILVDRYYHGSVVVDPYVALLGGD